MQRLLQMRMKLIKSGFTLTELLVAAVIAIFIVGAAVSFFYSTNRASSMGVSRQELQNAAHVVLTRMVDGKSLPSGIPLSEAVSCHQPGGILSELHFIDINGTERSFRLGAASRSVIYNYPSGPGTVDEVIYTAPAGANVTLRFSEPYPDIVVNIDVAITGNVSGRTVCGSASTYVNMRNHNT